jgi:acyl-CoA-dependent ceramide synthase
MIPYFATFTCVWIYLRHYINLRIIWSVLNEFETVGPFELNWETEQYKCRLAQYITFSLLASLQALNLFWLFYILRIAYRFAVYQVADDDREEGEDEIDDDKAGLVDGGDGDHEATPLVEAIQEGEKPSFADTVKQNGSANGGVKGENGAVTSGSQRKTRSKKA